MTSLHTPAAALEAARNHYAAALAAHDHLTDIYDRAGRGGYRPDPTDVAAAHDAVRFGLKAGDLAASIAIAADLVAVDTRARLVASAPRTSDRVRALAGCGNRYGATDLRCTLPPAHDGAHTTPTGDGVWSWT
jgi:hypothetical protein